MVNENVAISLSKTNELYKLMNYKALCDSIQKEIDNTLLPLRKKVLRGYYLNKKINEELESMIIQDIDKTNLNVKIIEDLRSIQSEISSVFETLKNGLRNTSFLDVSNIDTIEDSKLLSMFSDNLFIEDYINIRNLSDNLIMQREIPIDLTQKANSSISHSNTKISTNVQASKNNSQDLSDCLKIQEIHDYLSNIVNRAIQIRLFFKENNNEDFLVNHTITEIREVINDGIN